MTRKPKTYFATRGNLTTSDKHLTRKEAKAELEIMIDWALNAPSTHIENRYGLLIVLSGEPSGFCYSIINPAESTHVKTHWASCCLGQIEYTDALNAARSHACQYAWTPAVNDADHIIAAQVLPHTSKELARLFEHYRMITPTEHEKSEWRQ